MLSVFILLSYLIWLFIFVSRDLISASLAYHAMWLDDIFIKHNDLMTLC